MNWERAWERYLGKKRKGKGIRVCAEWGSGGSMAWVCGV